MRPHSTRLFVLSLSVLLVGLSSAFADLAAMMPEIGSLEQWSVFTLGATTQKNKLFGDAFVDGDVGIGGMAGIVLNANSKIDGDLVYRSNGTIKMSPNAVITGSQIGTQDAQIDSDIAAARATSISASNLAATFPGATTINLRQSQAMNLSGAPGETVVLKLDSFTLHGNSTFTLEGTATTTFVINVSSQFSLKGNSQIVLSGGVQWTNVLFNVTGTKGSVWLGRNARLEGILMANNRTVRLAGNATVAGTIIANRVLFGNARVGGHATVSHPPIVSP